MVQNTTAMILILYLKEIKMLQYNSDSDQLRRIIDDYNRDFDFATNAQPNLRARAMYALDRAIVGVVTQAQELDKKWCEHNAWRILNAIDKVQELHQQYGTQITGKNLVKLAQHITVIDEEIAKFRTNYLLTMLNITSFLLKVPCCYYLFYSGKGAYDTTAGAYQYFTGNTEVTKTTIMSGLGLFGSSAAKALGTYCAASLVNNVHDALKEHKEIREEMIKPKRII